MFRESDVIDLCEQVLDCSLQFWDNPNGGYEYTCPLCSNYYEVKGDVDVDITNFHHDELCAYLIAKDLMTTRQKKIKENAVENPATNKGSQRKATANHLSNVVNNKPLFGIL